MLGEVSKGDIMDSIKDPLKKRIESLSSKIEEVDSKELTRLGITGNPIDQVKYQFILAMEAIERDAAVERHTGELAKWTKVLAVITGAYATIAFLTLAFR